MSEYTLALSEAEIGRYQKMARQAVAREASQLAAAGVVTGATVADIGCGPAAMSIELARLVGPSGQVMAIERDKQALATAAILVQRSGAHNISLHEAGATATGLEPGSVDVAMLRHVLAHNGGHEQAIVDHLAALIRPRRGPPAMPCSPTASWTRRCCVAGRPPWPGLIPHQSGPPYSCRISSASADGRRERDPLLRRT